MAEVKNVQTDNFQKKKRKKEKNYNKLTKLLVDMHLSWFELKANYSDDIVSF